MHSEACLHGPVDEVIDFFFCVQVCRTEIKRTWISVVVCGREDGQMQTQRRRRNRSRNTQSIFPASYRCQDDMQRKVDCALQINFARMKMCPAFHRFAF